MIEIVDVPLTQWDVNRKVEVTGEAKYVHFANAGDSKAVKLPLVNGQCEIPEHLLQTGKALNVYAVLEGVTLESRSFAVRKRERPEDYIYEPDKRDYIYTLIDEANDAIKNANDAAEEAREAAENCSGGGGGNVLNVWVEGNEADHTSMEIYEHVDNYRGPVQLRCDGGYYQLLHVEDGGSAYFGYIADEQLLKAVLINGNNVERYEHWFTSPDNINEAIGDMVKTVNGISPDKNGNVYIEVGGDGFTCLTPQQFGAKADGVTDDTAAIQAAFNACNAEGGGTVYFPKGLYLLGDAIKFYSNMHIVGEQGAVLLQRDGNTGGYNYGNLMRNYNNGGGGYSVTENVVIEGITFDGGDQDTHPSTLLAFCHSQNVTVKGCRFVNGLGNSTVGNAHDIEVNSSQKVKIINCEFDGSRRTYKYSEQIQLDAFYMQVAYPWLPDEGTNNNIDNTITNDVYITGCLFKGVPYDGSTSNSSVAIGNHGKANGNNGADFVRIINNVFEDGYICVNMQCGNNTNINYNYITGHFLGCFIGNSGTCVGNVCEEDLSTQFRNTALNGSCNIVAGVNIDDKTGDISTALDHIIALQEELIDT